jgi:hypothetical protein
MNAVVRLVVGYLNESLVSCCIEMIVNIIYIKLHVEANIVMNTDRKHLLAVFRK